jgi:hypothetical protein
VVPLRWGKTNCREVDVERKVSGLDVLASMEWQGTPVKANVRCSSPSKRETDRTVLRWRLYGVRLTPGEKGQSGADQESGWCRAAEAYCFSLSRLPVAAFEEDLEWLGVGSV